MKPLIRIMAVGLLMALFAGCAAVADDLRRAERSYDEARFEDSLVWLTDLERDAPAMNQEMRARYYYLRGMTEYRLEHRANALHYLAIAREIVGERGRGLRPERRHIMERALAELTPRGADYRPAGESDAVMSTSGGQVESASSPPTAP